MALLIYGKVHRNHEHHRGHWRSKYCHGPHHYGHALATDLETATNNISEMGSLGRFQHGTLVSSSHTILAASI